MTTLTTAKVGHRSKEPAVKEIDGFRGQLISPDHAEYDIARAVWNGAIDRRPSLIARCIGTVDVVSAVRFARDNDLAIAIRGAEATMWQAPPFAMTGLSSTSRRCGP